MDCRFYRRKPAYAVGFSIGGRGYVGTGGNLSGNTYKDFWKYNNGAALPVAIASMSTTKIVSATFNVGSDYKLYPNPVSRHITSR